MKLKSSSLRISISLNKLLAREREREREKSQINYTKNEEDSTRNCTGIKMIIREYYELLYGNTFYNFVKKKKTHTRTHHLTPARITIIKTVKR